MKAQGAPNAQDAPDNPTKPCMEYSQVELKTFLKNKGIKTSGPKRVLCQRLLDASSPSQQQFFPGFVPSTAIGPVGPSKVLDNPQLDFGDSYTKPKDLSHRIENVIGRLEDITMDDFINDLANDLTKDDPADELVNNLSREVSQTMTQEAPKLTLEPIPPLPQPFLSDEDYAAVFDKFVHPDAQAKIISQHKKRTQDRLMKSKAVKPTFLKINETHIKDLEEVLQNLSSPLTVKGSDLKLISKTVERALGLTN